MTALPGAPIATGRTAEIFAWQEGTILKLYRAWCPPDWVDHELKIARVVHDAGLASPAPGEIVDVAGRRGLVYERIDGPSMLDMLKSQPWQVRSLARQMADLHIAMHTCAGTGLSSFNDYLGRAIRAAPGLPDDLRALALERLASLPKGDRLCHGDFHPGNIMLTKRGPVVIDWMTAMHGQPLADVARSVMLLHSRPPDIGKPLLLAFSIIVSQFESAYLARYFATQPDERKHLGAWLPLIAAARMAENIAGERDWLVEMVRVGLHTV